LAVVRVADVQVAVVLEPILSMPIGVTMTGFKRALKHVLLLPVMHPSYICLVMSRADSQVQRIRVIKKFFNSELSHDKIKSNQSQVTRTVESLRVIAFQMLVKISSMFFFTTTTKWRPMLFKIYFTSKLRSEFFVKTDFELSFCFSPFFSVNS